MEEFGLQPAITAVVDLLDEDAEPLEVRFLGGPAEAHPYFGGCGGSAGIPIIDYRIVRTIDTIYSAPKATSSFPER